MISRRSIAHVRAWAFVPFLLGSAAPASAQHPHQATVTVPFNQVGNGFSEQIGVNLNFNVGDRFFFQENLGGGLASHSAALHRRRG